MEKIKRKIRRAVITGITETNSGYTYVIIPNPKAYYRIQILLTSKALDWGTFDSYYLDGTLPQYGQTLYGDFVNPPIGLQNLL